MRATGGSSGIDATLLINDTIELGTVSFQKDVSVGVVVDLGNAQAASEFVNSTLGTDSPFSRLTFTGMGKVQVALHKWATSDFEATVALLTDVSGTVTDDKGFSRSGSSQARSALLSARVDGPNTTVSASLDVGTSVFRGVWSDFFGASLTDPMTWTLSGLTLKATAKDGGDRTVTGISTGTDTSTLKFGDTVVASFDLNSGLQRRFDVAVTTGAGGLDAFTATPGITGTLVLALQPVANAGQQIDSDLLDATYEYDFTSMGQAPQIELTRATQTADGAWKLNQGTVSLSSPSGSPRTFNAVSCMTFRSGSLMSGENRFLDLFVTQACP